MKLTKLQRYTAYCIMLVELNKWGYLGLCSAAGKLELDMPGCLAIDTLLPELRNKLYCISPYWRRERVFSYETGYNQRVKLLNQCIIETHP